MLADLSLPQGIHEESEVTPGPATPEEGDVRGKPKEKKKGDQEQQQEEITATRREVITGEEFGCWKLYGCYIFTCLL